MSFYANLSNAILSFSIIIYMLINRKGCSMVDYETIVMEEETINYLKYVLTFTPKKRSMYCIDFSINKKKLIIIFSIVHIQKH